VRFGPCRLERTPAVRVCPQPVVAGPGRHRRGSDCGCWSPAMGADSRGVCRPQQPSDSSMKSDANAPETPSGRGVFARSRRSCRGRMEPLIVSLRQKRMAVIADRHLTSDRNWTGTPRVRRAARSTRRTRTAIRDRSCANDRDRRSHRPRSPRLPTSTRSNARTAFGGSATSEHSGDYFDHEALSSRPISRRVKRSAPLPKSPRQGSECHRSPVPRDSLRDAERSSRRLPTTPFNARRCADLDAGSPISHQLDVVGKAGFEPATPCSQI
jgi:hypothetical protein